MFHALSSVSYNDAVLLISITYSSYDVFCKWSEFDTCSKPIQWQLVVSYALVVAFRVSHFLGQRYADEGEDFLLSFRHKKRVPRALVYFTWAFTLPLFTIWTVVGTAWLYNIYYTSPNCLPVSTQPWFLVFWQVLSYLWIAVHVVFCGIACDFERRIRFAENNFQQLMSEEGTDISARWGHITELPGYGAITWLKKRGLSADEVRKLPCSTRTSGSAECSICLSNIDEGEAERTLPGCGHTFHKACIDLWLLRCADCPLCKCEVTGGQSQKCCAMV